MSVIAALCVPPTRDEVRLFLRLHPDANVDAGRTVDFLRQLDRQLDAPCTVVWDRLQAHRS